MFRSPMPSVLLFLLIVMPLVEAHAQTHRPSKTPTQQSLDPWNKPMDELGVTGKDDTLCSDRWYSCTTYDRLQFDQRYPGKPLNELLRFGEPDWPDQDSRSHRSGTYDVDRMDDGGRSEDKLDKD